MASDKLFDLTDRVAVVAGGAGHLGSEICRGLIRQGAHVVVADIDLARAERLAAELGGGASSQRARAYSLDVTQEDSIRRLVDGVDADFKRLDVLVNATMAPQRKSLTDIDAEEFTRSLGGNVSAAFVLAREAKRLMRRGGSIILFSSMYARVAPDPRVYGNEVRPNAIEYGAAKAGIEQMIRYLAVVWAPDGVRVNGIAPGAFPNPQVQESHPDLAARLAQKVPMGRLGRPEELVGAAVFLASDAASYMTGQTLVVDGGWTIW